MAFYRAAIGGGGGQPTETTLWTNPSPSSSFAGQTVTLSDDMTNYDYLKFTYKAVSTLDTLGEDIIPTAKFVSYGSSMTTAGPKFAIGKTGTSSDDRYIRFLTYSSNTTIDFKTPQKAGAAQTSNNACIPVQIIGIKNPVSIKYANMKTVALKGSVTDEFVATDFTPSRAYWYRNDFAASNASYGIAIKNVGTFSARVNNSGSPNISTNLVSVSFGNNGITYSNPNGYATTYPHTLVILGEMS